MCTNKNLQNFVYIIYNHYNLNIYHPLNYPSTNATIDPSQHIYYLCVIVFKFFYI